MTEKSEPVRGEPSFWRSAVWKFARIVFLVFIVIAVLMVFFEEKLIYFPTKYPIGDWSPAGLQFQDAHFSAADGTRIHGWFFEHQKPERVMLYCHGNADFVANLGELGQAWSQIFSANVLIFDYRGYGRSEGKPNEEGTLQDARAARKWLANRSQVDESDVILIGRSLGGGVACAIASDPPAKLLVLQNTFTSLPAVAAIHYPWFPVNWLMRNRYDSIKNLQRYPGPVFQCHGTADEIVPIELGRQLHDSISGPKEFFEIQGAGHNAGVPPEFFVRLNRFLKEN